MIKSINFVVLGEQTIANDFGKKGTSTDLTLYDKKESEIIRTWITPNGFPDKIQPLFQAINLAEYVIFYVGSLDKFAGEQIIALDMLKRKNGIISHTYEVDEARLMAMIKGTVLEQYRHATSPEIKQEINKLQPILKEGKTKIVIDHCFDVKGVGTVVLGKVTQGKVKQYDNLKLFPSGVDVMIKSIQMHDDPAEEAISPARVGLSVKGVKVDEITRGDYLCEDTTQNVQTEIELDFTQNPFYKGTISENQMCLVSVGMQIKAGKFKSITPLVIQLDKPIVCDKNDICVILKPESSSVRILGSGPIL
jgi:selenocysteine-specific translation elongation factor